MICRGRYPPGDAQKKVKVTPLYADIKLARAAYLFLAFAAAVGPQKASSYAHMVLEA
jgi:hypothetical protein